MFNVTWKPKKKSEERKTYVLDGDLAHATVYNLLAGDVSLDDESFKNAFREPIAKKYPGTGLRVKDIIIVNVERI